MALGAVHQFLHIVCSVKWLNCLIFFFLTCNQGIYFLNGCYFSSYLPHPQWLQDYHVRFVCWFDASQKTGYIGRINQLVTNSKRKEKGNSYWLIQENGEVRLTWHNMALCSLTSLYVVSCMYIGLYDEGSWMVILMILDDELLVLSVHEKLNAHILNKTNE